MTDKYLLEDKKKSKGVCLSDTIFMNTNVEIDMIADKVEIAREDRGVTNRWRQSVVSFLTTSPCFLERDGMIHSPIVIHFITMRKGMKLRERKNILFSSTF